MDKLDTKSSNNIIAILGNFLLKGEKFKAIQLLRNLKNENNIDITYLIDQILPLGDIVFYRYVKSESRKMINSFHAFDKILHTNDTNLVLDLLKFDIIEPYYSAKVNNTNIETVIYMIIQLSEYNEEVKQYLFQKYSISIGNYNNISEEGLLKHMLLENVCNDIFVYIRTSLEYNMTAPEVLNFNKILESYQVMYDKYKDDPKENKRLRSRLIGITQLINNQCLEHLLMLPEYIDYKAKFESYYEFKDTRSHEIKQLLEQICYDSYEYINYRVPWGSQR
jgi:hypothetical protein